MAVVRAFMAHHQGMTIVAIADALLDGAMRRRFHAEPMMRAAELLLQERMPREIAVQPPWASDAASAAKVRELEAPVVARRVDPDAATPATHLLSNDRYSVMLTAAGSGYSRWGNLAVTRWREDATCDDWGSYVYFRDVETDAVWSAGTGAERRGAGPLRRHVQRRSSHILAARRRVEYDPRRRGFGRGRRRGPSRDD